MTNQIQWMVPEIVGQKGAHRSTQRKLKEGESRFDKIEADLKPLSELRTVWIARKKMVATLVILPAMSVLLAEIFKPWMLKLFGINP